MLRQKELATAGDPEAFYHADEEFHLAIAEAAGFPGVWPLVLQVKVQVDRYCHLTLPTPGRMDRLFREHKAIADGIARHDGDQASAALDIHIGGLMADLAVAPGSILNISAAIRTAADGAHPTAT